MFVCVGTNKSSIKLKEPPEDGRYKSKEIEEEEEERLQVLGRGVSWRASGNRGEGASVRFHFD